MKYLVAVSQLKQYLSRKNPRRKYAASGFVLLAEGCDAAAYRDKEEQLCGSLGWERHIIISSP